jgi:polysaccharide export outer membrane protein
MRLTNLLLIIVLAAAAASVGNAQQMESLLIGPGDLLQLKVLDTPELDEAVRVTDAGTISLLVGGDVDVLLQTPEAAARKIEAALFGGRFLLHPHVSVSIAEFATQKVSVMGEVRAPGAYAITTSRSVLDVLTLAGGLNEVADRRVVIQRRGSRERIPYFVSNIPDVALGSTVTVNPGDSILVAKAGIVYVLGDVAHPGGYTMNSNEARISALQLIARAGGTNHSAVPSRARLMRRSGSTYSQIPLQLSAMQKGKEPDLELEANDIIYVPFSYLRNFGIQATSVVGSLGSAAIYAF